MKKIILFPGAFNPPHNGHVNALVKVLGKIPFDEVWIVPSGKREDKEIAITYENRRNLSAFFVDCLKQKVNVPVLLLTNELDDKKNRKTEEVLRGIKSQKDVDIVQLIGIDGYLKIKDGVDKDEKFAVIARSGCEIPADFRVREGDVFLNEPVDGISSTHIRELVRHSDRRYKDMVPERVAEYIEEHKLYQ